jgi:protease-4
LLIQPVSTRRALVETELDRDSPLALDKLVVIDVSGVLRNAHAPQFLTEGEHPVSLLLEQLDRARKDPRVKGVLLRINSPGGTVTAAELMHAEIRRFRQQTGKPVTAVLMDVAASGGYYVACACDEIVAQKTTVTGSIGVIMLTFDLSGTMNLIGVKCDAIVSGPHKDTGSPLRPMRPEERELFQTLVDKLYDGFVEVVRQGRPKLDAERVRALADGRVYLADQALENGLIDRIASMREAGESMKRRTGSRRIRLVTYHRPLDYRPNYYARAAGSPVSGDTELNLLKIEWPGFGLPPAPQFLYLWHGQMPNSP